MLSMNSSNDWRVDTAKKVDKFLQSIPLADHERLISAFDDFVHNPWHGDIVKLKGEPNSWRRRVGNYRIFYTIHQDQHAVWIGEVDRRTTTTYRGR